MANYSVASVSLGLVPDMRGFFTDVERQFNKAPKYKVAPEVDEKPAEREMGKSGRFGGMMLAAGAAIGAAVGAAIVSAMDISSAQSKLAAQLGGSNPEYAKDMGAIAGKIYSNAFGGSLEEVNDALRSVVTSGAVMEDATNEQIQSVTQNVLSLANAFGVDVPRATQAIGQMVKTGLVPDAQTATDVLTRMFQQFGPGAEDVLDTFIEYSVQFQKIGLDAQTTGGLIAQMMSAGARSTDLAADALKEFSIRSIDGSKTTVTGYQQIGLNAEEMRKKLAAGGPTAQAAFAEVVNALKSVKDPAVQAEAAVNLFGTQAEDLGAALYAIDPSTAVKGLGDVAGAADKMSETLQDNAGARIESFKRSLQTGITDFIGAKLLPAFDALVNIGPKIFGDNWDGVRQFLGFFLTVGGSVVGVILAVVGAIKVWTLVQTAWNAVMAANPLGLVVIAIVALVAAVIYAYNNFDWFRNIVDSVWGFLKQVGAWIGGAFVAVWDALVVAFQFVGSVFSAVWSGFLKPVFDALVTVGKFVAAVLITIVFTPIYLAFQLLAAIFTAVWNSVLKPVFQALGDVAVWLWRNVLQPTFSAIMTAFRAVGDFFGWVYANLLKPAFDAWAQVAQWLWRNVLQPVFGWIAAGWRGLIDGISWVWSNLLRPALEGVGRGFDGVWQVVRNVVQWIGDRWRDLQELTRKPVEFIVNTVYNNGIRKVWNGVAKTFGLGELGEVRFAKGGILPGYTPGRDIHTFYNPALGALHLSGGEGILVPEAVRGLGGPAFVGAANRYFSGGRSNGGAGTGSSFADGGIWGAIVNAAKGIPGIGSLVTAADAASVGASIMTGGDLRKVLKPLIDSLAGNLGAGGWSDMLRKMVERIIDGAAKTVDDNMASYGGGGGGGVAAPQQVVAWIMQALGFTGTPASWLGPLQTLIMRESGGNPRAINLWDSNAKKGTPSMGLMQTIGPTFQSNRDPRLPNDPYNPVANIVAGINYIKRRYGSVFNVQQAVGATPKGYDNGGWLMPGLGQYYNGTGKPEAVFTNDQWSMLRDNLNLSEGGSATTIHVNPSAPLDEVALARETSRQLNFQRRVAASV